MGSPVHRRQHQAALSIWLVCAAWMALFVAAVAAGNHAFRGRPPNALGIPEGLGEYLFVNLCWIAVFGWPGYEVWHGRKILGAVGIFVPITLVYSAIGLALSLSGETHVDYFSFPVSLVVLVGGLITTVFLVRAANTPPS